MAVKTLINVAVNSTSVGEGDKVLTPSERALLLKSDTSFMAAPWLNTVEAGGIANAKATSSDTALYAAPTVSETFPALVAGGGPDGEPYYKAKAADPVGGLFTASGSVDRTGDWTFSFVGKASTNTSGGIVGIAGNGGGALAIALRTGNIVQVLNYNGSGVATSIATAAASTTDWHHIIVSYDLSETTLKIWVDGSLITTEVSAITLADSRLTMFSTRDPSSTPAVVADADSASLASLFVVNEYVGGADTSTLDLLIGAATERFPSIFA